MGGVLLWGPDRVKDVLETWRRLDMRRRIVLVTAAVLTFVAVLSLARLATQPNMALLYSGLDPATAGEVLGELEQLQVPSEIRGDAIFVADSQRDRVRLTLARQGLPRQGQAGYELLDGISGFSSTSDMFNAAYWRAKEGELARTILASPGIRAARVHLAVPARRPFARAEAKPTASVTVTMAGGRLTTQQATALRYLVALAVAGLEPEEVAVIDSRAGMVLAPGSSSAAEAASATGAERQARLKSEIEQLLAARVGRDRARVSVAVEIDREAETVVEKRILPDSRVVIHSETEEISDAAQGQEGNVTVASNLPGGDAGGANRTSNRAETRERSNFEYSETRTERRREAGAIRRISVAVLVDGITEPGPDGVPTWRPRDEAELTALRELVSAAIGFDAERGDIVTVETMAFQSDATPGELVEANPVTRFVERNALALIQIGVLALVAIVLGLTVLRPLLARRDDAEAQVYGPGDPLPIANDGAALPTPDGAEASDAEPEMSTLPAPTPAMLRSVVSDRRDQSAATLKEWLEPDSQTEAAA